MIAPEGAAVPAEGTQPDELPATRPRPPRTPKATLHEWSTKSKSRLQFSFNVVPDEPEAVPEGEEPGRTFLCDLSITGGYTNVGKVRSMCVAVG